LSKSVHVDPDMPPARHGGRDERIERDIDRLAVTRVFREEPEAALPSTILDDDRHFPKPSDAAPDQPGFAGALADFPHQLPEAAPDDYRVVVDGVPFRIEP